MRAFNRLVMALIFAALVALGVFAVLFSWGLYGYRISGLPFGGFSDGLNSFVKAIEVGNLSTSVIAIMVVVAIAGLILLLMELKPPRPKHVRIQPGVQITRRAVEEEAITVAEQTGNVLSSWARAKPRRRPGAVVRLQDTVRRGEDLKAIRSELRERVSQRLQNNGVRVRKLKVKLVEADPRTAQARVR